MSKLVCYDMVAVMRKATLEHHYTVKHTKVDELQEEMHLFKLILFRGVWVSNKQLSQDHIHTETVMQARFVVRKLIAKRLRSHSEGAFVKECLFADAELLAPHKIKLF